MQKKLILTIGVVFLFIFIMLSGCDEFGLMEPTQEDIDWLSSDRVYVTVTSHVTLISSDYIPMEDETVFLQISSNYEIHYQKNGLTDENGFVDFGSRTYRIDENDKITVTATHLRSGKKDVVSLDYSTAKNYAIYNQEHDDYEYSWYAYLTIMV